MISIEQAAQTLVLISNSLAYQSERREDSCDLSQNIRVNSVLQDFEDQVSKALCLKLAAQDALLELNSFHP